tara:strand:+ start:3497 stop:5524 length:2028 start_codon:yes stop_codon:yes gene_type:complete
MKKILLPLVAFFLNNITAQNTQQAPCYFDEYTNNKSILETESKIQTKVAQLKNEANNKAGDDSVKIIPVVVHVLHYGGAANISDAQIQSQIDIMNEDYGKLPGTNGDGNGVDTKVRFCLAKIDPSGNCTNGIVRIYTVLSYHKTYQRAMLKELSFWDNQKYLNIYVVKSINGGSGIAGYSSFPGGPDEEDGMVVLHNQFGNIGSASSSLGRTASHEIGHWFGLYHTFNNGCGTDVCLDGDYVCDTPPQFEPSYGCSTLNSCSNDVPDLNDQKENYMNYTSDNCKNMFTEGQKLRIQATLDTIRTTIWSQTNLIETGCDSAYTAPAVCGVAANFVTLTPTLCIGNSTKFMDISLNDATSWQWSFPGGTPTSSTIENPTITYNSVGSFDVQLIASNATTTDTLLLTNYIDVSTPGIGNALPFYENFDSGTFPPQGIVINNADGGITWELDSAASVSGNYSIKIDNYINTNYGSADDIVLPDFDLTNISNPYMTFKWAYAKSDPSYSDELAVLLSKDCGANYTTIFYKTQANLVTGPTQTTPFIPDSTQWKSAQISLNAYSSEQFVQIKIVNITDGGNNLYIDDINIGDLTTGIDQINQKSNFNIYPNPTSDKLTIEFDKKTTDQKIKIYNAVGKLMLSEAIDNKTHTLSVHHLPSGIYYVELYQNNSKHTQKLVITK